MSVGAAPVEGEHAERIDAARCPQDLDILATGTYTLTLFARGTSTGTYSFELRLGD